MRGKIISTVLSTVILMTMMVFPVSANSDVNLKTETLDFISTTLSDFAMETTYQDNLIDNSSTVFKQFLDDKRKITNLKQELSGAWKLMSEEVTEFSAERLNDNIYEVTCKIKYDFIVEGQEDLFHIVEGYKLNVFFEDGKLKVLAAMSNGLSSGTIYPYNIVTQEQDFDLSIFLNDTSAKKNKTDYDIDEIEKRLITAHDQMVNEQNMKSSKESEDDFLEEGTVTTDSVSQKSITWNFFSSSEKSSMTTYQNNWHDSFNPNYADFSGSGGDCTNYASQILRAGGSAFNEYSGSGIWGDTYWYYRDSSNRSTSWTKAENLKNFLLRSNNTLGPKARVVSRFQDLDVGSIIFLGSSSSPYHSVIVHTAGGDPIVTAHSSPYKGNYSLRYSGSSHTKVEVRGYYD